jgi:2-polyprenyl-3-methyl-5-hydroxy-6-metoxy-1,4-benzoquinol methylase
MDKDIANMSLDQKIDFILTLRHDVDQHLNRVTNLAQVLGDLKGILQELLESTDRQKKAEYASLRDEIAILREHLEAAGLPKLDLYERRLSFIRQKLESSDWPIAVPPESIPASEADEHMRASKIIDMFIHQYPQGKRFLDFGCGHGYAVMAANKREAVKAVGYDPKGEWRFGNSDAVLFTKSIAEVSASGPYDIVLLWDVLDHLDTDPIEVLQSLVPLLSPEGRIYVRCHPWSSKHGGHLYTQKNKAFLHLVLDEVELMRIAGVGSEHVFKIVRPLETYPDWFEKAGLKVLHNNPRKETVPSFFTDPENHLIMGAIRKHWGHQDPVDHMSVQYVDYILEPAQSDKVIF